MQYLCPNCGSFMEVISTASFPPIITYHCFNCGFKSKPLKETVECAYLPMDLWAEEDDDEIQHNR